MSSTQPSPPSASDRSADPAIDVRLVSTHAEYAACERMSLDIWGVADRNIVPRELLLTMQLNGGLVHGAFLPSGRLIGFCFAFAGRRDGRLRLCSHQLGVLPEYRGAGVGVALKLAQKRDALRLGYELISWTFDPLEARNAYLNLHRLGCIARLYDRDHYGPMDDELNRGLPSDRLEAEWWLGKTKPLPSHEGIPTLLARGDHGEPVAHDQVVPAAPGVWIEVPTDVQAVKRQNMELARHWRFASRKAFEAALSAGLIAVDFRRDGAYLMAPAA